VVGVVPVGDVRIPDLTGWPMREAVKEATRLGVQPQVRGSGLLSRQIPAPGATLTKGQPFIMEFEPAT
jgi:hypothetical protein